VTHREGGGLQLGAVLTSDQAHEQKPAKGRVKGKAAANQNHNSTVEGPRSNNARPNVGTRREATDR
jgi:hypothetical protein